MKKTKTLIRAVLPLLLIAVLLAGCGLRKVPEVLESVATIAPAIPTQAPTTVPTEPPILWETGFVSALSTEVEYCDETGAALGTIARGTQVEYTCSPSGKIAVLVDGVEGYLQEDAMIVSDVSESIPEHTLFVRSAVNMRDADGKLLETFAEKGQSLEVTGFDYLQEDGTAHMYRVALDGAEGYIMPWYVVDNEADALANYDAGSYAIHAGREDRYGGGGAANLDYFPREKGVIEGNEMPEECRTLYIAAWCVGNVDAYLEIANNSGINAFVVDILDGGSVGYAADVMKAYSPTAAAKANNTVAQYQAAIQKLKNAGYYVIGRITTFNDTSFIRDHPECGITDTAGAPLKLSGEYWPTPYNRTAWQYKVDLAVEAVELMGFHEIQFDYIRFPDNTWNYDKAGTIDYHNTYNETKAQAIQRFLMYATDILHEKGVYVSADVFGECAYNYVTAYGQYWPAISNVADAISGMPYPDHFSASGDWLPWEHPYDTLYSWGECAVSRQAETATPAAIRTWIQAYNAIRQPYNTYGPDEVFAQIRALRDSGCTGGYMTWHSGASVEKYTMLMSAFTPPETT